MLSPLVVVSFKANRARQRGFTLVELIAVILILSSLVWLSVRSFSPSLFHTYSYTQVLSQYIARAQSLALANQDKENVYVELNTLEEKPVILLLISDQLVSRFESKERFSVRSLEGELSSKSLRLAWRKDGQLNAARPQPLKLSVDKESKLICIMLNGEVIEDQTIAASECGGL